MLYLNKQRTSEDAKGTSKNSQKCDVRGRCGAWRICRVVVHVLSIISSILVSRKTHVKYSQHDIKKGLVAFFPFVLHI